MRLSCDTRFGSYRLSDFLPECVGDIAGNPITFEAGTASHSHSAATAHHVAAVDGGLLQARRIRPGRSCAPRRTPTQQSTQR